MKKTYTVSVVAFANVLVIDAANESEAMQLACDEIDFGDLQMDEASVKDELTTTERIDSARRHADRVIDATDFD
jgi:hypothetical protein